MCVRACVRACVYVYVYIYVYVYMYMYICIYVPVNSDILNSNLNIFKHFFHLLNDNNKTIHKGTYCTQIVLKQLVLNTTRLPSRS